MKCKKEGCGADLGPDTQFCSDCGTKVTAPTLIKSAICPSCNNFVLEVHKFCLKCGTRVDPALFTDKVCSGTKKDGEKCNTALASGANFCPSCGMSTLQADVTAVSREDHISVPITYSTERLDQEKGDSSSSGSNSPEIWVAPAIIMVHSEQNDDVNTSDQSEILHAENNRHLTLNDNSPCPEETEINSSDQIELVGVQLSENDDRSKDGMTSTGSHQEVPMLSDSESVFTKKKNIELISSEDYIKENDGKQLKKKAKETEKAETSKKEEEKELCKLLEEINLTDKLTNETHVQNTQDIKEKPKKESSVDQQTEENEDKPTDGTELDQVREKITQDELQALEREKDIKEKPKKESSVDQQTEENEDKPTDGTELDQVREKITQDELQALEREKDVKEQAKIESSVDQQTEENEDKPTDGTELDQVREKITQDELQALKREKDIKEKPKKESRVDQQTEENEDKPTDGTELDQVREKITQDELQALEREKDIKEKPKKESSVDQQTEENEDKPTDGTELDQVREKITQDELQALEREKDIKEKPKKESSVDQQTEENEDKPTDGTELDQDIKEKPKKESSVDQQTEENEDKPTDGTELDQVREKITQDELQALEREKDIKEKPKKESSVDQQTEENEDKPTDGTELDQVREKITQDELQALEREKDIKEKPKKESSVDQQTEENEDKPTDGTELDQVREKITQDELQALEREKDIKEKPKKESSVDQQTEENEDKPTDGTELDQVREKITQDELQALEREKDVKEQAKIESSVDQQTEENEDKPTDGTELDQVREKITQDELQALEREKDIKEKPKKESSVDQQTEENEDKPTDGTELDQVREKITQDELQALEREKDIKEKPKKESSVDQQTEENEDKPTDGTELDQVREKITQDELQALEREKDIKEKPKKESSVDQQTEENEDKPTDGTELDQVREKITQDELQALEREKDCDSEDDDSEGPSSDRNKNEEQNTGRITRSTAKATKEDANKTKNRNQTKNKETQQQKMAKSGTNKRLDGKGEKERTSSDANFEVTFHAIMHSSIYKDTSTAYVRFSLDILGGWTGRKHKMHFIRKLDDGSYEVEGVVSIPRGHLSTAILFRYFVVSGDTQWEEFVYNEQKNMRTLYVIPNDIKLYDGRFHQYDGVIRVKETKVGWANMCYHYSGLEDSQYRKVLHKDAVLSAYVFLPVWQTVIKPSSGCSGEEMIMRIQSVLKGLQKTYWMLNTGKYDFPSFREALISRFDALWQEFVDKQNYCREDRIKIMTNALTVICLFNEHNLTLSMDEGSALFRALLPECEKEGNKYMENIKEVFPQTIRMLPQNLLKFAESGIKIASPNWIFCMPMMHFLFNQCCPGEKPPDIVNHDSFIPEWWGIAKKDNYGLDLKEYKKKPIERPLLVEILVILSPYFEVDYLLPRTLMACLTLEQLPIVVKSGLIPPDITLASLCFHVRKESQIFKNSVKEMAIIDCLTLVISKFTNLKEDAERSTEVLSCAWRSYLIAADVIKSMHEYSGNKLTDNVMSLALESFLISLHVYYTTYTVLTETTGEQKRMEDYGGILDSVRSSTRQWLNNKIWHCKHDELLACLESWNRVLNVAVPESVIKDEFIKFIADTLYESLIKKNFEEKVVKVYCKYQGLFCNAMLDILTKYAIRAVEKITNNFTYSISKWKRDQLNNLGRLLSTVFEEKVGDLNVGDVSSILPFLLNWIPFPIFVKMFNNNIHAAFLSDKCVALMKDYNGCIVKVVEEINDRSISVALLQIIEEKQEHLCSIIADIPGLNAKEFKISFELRLAEMNAYNECIRNLKKFIDICQRCEANTSKLEEQIKRYQEFDRVSLKNIYDKVKVPKDIKKYQPKVIALEVDRYILDTLPEMIRCTKGNIFIIIWDKFATEFHKTIVRPLEIDELIEHVWKPTFKEWRHLHNRLKTGEILFSEFERICGRFDEKTLKREFLRLEGVESDNKIPWIQERIDQMNKYRNLQNYLDGASVIMEVVEEFELEGDFKAIKQILKLGKGKDTKMNKLKLSYLKTCSVLSYIDQKKIDCLDKFKKCKCLVDWLRETMPDGLQELKVFVDLAYISTGDDGMEIAKVRCLQSAAIGYAPLIFNLDLNCDYKVFLDRCEEVWKALDSNPNLPNELEDTNGKLEWLKIVEESHGSVEVTSLAQAEAINTSGTYYIGYVKKAKGKQQNQFSDVLGLTVTVKQESKTTIRKYNYAQLHDLQSRLMLVAGKAEMGKDDVDRFILILDSVVRLCNVYIKLLSSGCVLFSKFQVVFRCDPRSKACAFVNFGAGDDKQTIRGKTDKFSKDVSFFIPRIAKFLEHCHDRWLKFIDNERETHYILNFFTIEQMVILQEELVKLGFDTEPSNLVYPLLSIIKHDCTKEDLIEAMEEARKEIEEMNVDNQEEEEEILTKDETIETIKAKFILEMVEAGYSEGLAMEALNHVDPDEINEGIAWCIEHDGDEELETLHVNNETSEPEKKFSGWNTADSSLSTVREEMLQSIFVGAGQGTEDSVEPLIEKLEKLWEAFVTSISSSVSDYLSVEHLALILRKLAELETIAVDRSFSICGCKEGIPNLIICPQSEMYNTVLSLYSINDDSPLPLSDEVLLCTPQTTLDMLEIFWRRALFADGCKVHCLVNADLLDYEISDKGEKSLEKHMKNAQSQDKQFKLVVVCSSENEYKSRMVAALDKYHRPQFTLGGENHVKTFLSKRFTVDNLVNGIEPASYVDFDRSSIRVVKSWRAGVGKSLFKRNMVTALKERQNTMSEDTELVVTIPLYDKNIVIDEVMKILLTHTYPPHIKQPRIFHFDISHEVQDGVDAFLFQLLVLGCLINSSGNVWKRSEIDYYIIESIPLLARESDTQIGNLKCMHRCLDILPDVLCRSPKESLIILEENYPEDYHESDLLFDEKEFVSEVFQRPYQYLSQLDANKDLTGIDPEKPEGDKTKCLLTLLRHCGVKDPSWSELYHFVSFLNSQLLDFETSAFCNPLLKDDLPRFYNFVLIFMIQMSRDFATRSLLISEESPIDMLKRGLIEDGDDVEQLYEMRRTWETSPHPYLFFNPDHHTMTFLGFNIEQATGNLIDEQTGKILKKQIMEPTLYPGQPTLYNGLDGQPGVNLSEKFEQLSRSDKIVKLCHVMGIENPYDPDQTYELTTDNVKKILAIYMRFRCDIPVIIMGETGCGKTRLIKFMCSLQLMPGDAVENMIIMKVHGGTTGNDIMKKVRKAEKTARENAKKYPNMYTVLFFDEANTTEAIGVIKEIMCDKSLGGNPIQINERLKIIAACNPYRKHKEELIKKLEQAGLGYHVDADKTTDKLGRVPMRRLVYRVQPLPQSMLPLIWDFGQLNTEVEEMYIRQMVKRYVNDEKLPEITGLADVASRVLSACQNFMRMQKDECSFVSLRDVERVLEVMIWFYRQTEEEGLLSEENMDFDEDTVNIQITRAFILALGVCYQACLKKREEFRKMIFEYFEDPFTLLDENQLETEFTRCQDKFLDSVKLADNIAKNQALKENVFMMIVCIELRIPLFLVGKPGSSKSLAKTIVADAMQGDSSRNHFFKRYKQVQMVSFQCSPLSTPEGIVGTFKQCAEFQKAKDLDRFVSVVVLDEIGLAEDSPRMPLKTLHPLLEEGCPDDSDDDEDDNEDNDDDEDDNKDNDDDEDDNKDNDDDNKDNDDDFDDDEINFKKVAFIGISNWALDPAKMNRGIFVQREVPDETELINSARDICRTTKEEDRILKLIGNLIPSLSTSYSKLFSEAEKSKQREFFGLRDFYSLIKMVYAFAAKTEQKPTWLQLKHAVMRNFGGLENVDSVDIFRQCLKDTTVVMDETRQEGDPDCSSEGMIQACLEGGNTDTSETRYLLLLTENYGDLAILQQKILTVHHAVVIFGSSFPSDQEYTQVCRNINRIKVCMETGSTVILLNLENLYESLYDALNQYYVRYGGERYVDLGLGSHRVKCKVHKDFRLIVVAEKEIVYKKFPIPLINRLEKHVLSLSTMLSETQLNLAQKLEEWVKDFCHIETPSHLHRNRNREIKIGDVFMGYHSDTCAAIIMQLFEDKKCPHADLEQNVALEILHDAKSTLLWCAAPDAVLRLISTKLRDNKEEMMSIYFKQQQHDSLLQYLCCSIKEENKTHLYAQITTHSKLLSTPDLEVLCQFLPIQKQNMTLLTLQSFDTEQQFCRKIRFSLEENQDCDSLLIVQCDCGDQNSDLIACARYSIQRELQQITEKHEGNVHVVLIVQLPRVAGDSYTGFQCGLWHSAHIDDVRPPPDKMPSFIEMYHNPVSTFLQEEKKMDVDEENETLKIDIFSLINNCVQPALSKVKDPEEDSQRTTERIRMILKLIQDSREKGDKSFLSGISVHLKSLIKEKEEQESELYKEWLSTEASNPDHINRAGTFRRAAIQCLEEKMTKLLAGVIAFIDTNRNMNIIVNEESQNWQRFLWIEILNCPPVTQLQNIDFAVSEFVVQGTAYEGGYFSAAMPYSWLIYRYIEQLLKISFEEPQSQEDLSLFEQVKRTADRFESSTPLGQILSQIEGTDIQQVIKCYIKDFVYMAHPVKTEPEHLVICENIWIGCQQIIHGEIGCLFPALVGCHATFQFHGARFRNFSDIVFVWPECSERTLKFQEGADQELKSQEGADKELMYLVTTDEITLDLMGLHLLLNNLEPPTKEALNTPNSRKQWIKKMCDYRPVVERIFGYFQTEKHDLKPLKYSARCTQAVQTARYLWTRAVVLKLFIEHVCIEGTEIKRCRPFWVMLKKEADMKKLHSLEIVEKFLKSSNKDVSSKIFRQQTCAHCTEPYTGTPVTLPCTHTICRVCYDETVTSKNLICPKCDQRFQMNFNPIPADQSENIKIYQDFRRRCNSFFMEVVSQLCFAEGTPPSDEIIDKLLSYITMHTRKGKEVTKELTIFGDCIDRTPVVRSFLLQHLMQTSGDKVSQHLENYFKNALGLVEPSKSHDLSLLVVQCMEDSYHQQYPEENVNQIVKVTEMLGNLSKKQNLDAEQLLQSIERLSHTRFALGIAANFMYKIFVEKSVKLDTRRRKLFGAVGKLCEECESAWPRRYFVKYLCRCYGTDSYQTIRTDSDASIKRWISLPELQEDKTNECYDRFVVCGENYIEKRDNFVKAALNQDAKKIIVLLQCKNNKWKTEIRFLLVVYREFTMNFLYEEEQQKFSPQVKQFLQRTLMNCQKLSDKDLIRDMLTNSLWRHDPHMNISPTMDLGQQGISCLLVHCMVLFSQIAGKQTMLTPLVNLANKPELMIESYFPTMPQDDLDEIKEALLVARPEDGNENPVFYRCPNGHLYIIGDCGRPAFVDRCKSCGLEIGGEGYELKEGNVKDEGIDTTDTGHILGRAKNMNAAPFPERKLNIANCAIIRLLTHMAMYIGANHNVEAVCRSIKPDIEDTDVSTYIMDHIQKDLQSISRVLGKSKEDILILIHQLLNDIMDSQTAVKHGEGAEEDICFLKCKKSRGIWEKKFNKHHVVPILEKNEDILNTVNTQIVNDQRLGANPLLQLLYETDNPTQQAENLGENPSVWQYRERISVDHLMQMFARSGQNCPVLQQFLEEERFLRAIRFVPSIIQLQKILIQKYNRKLDRAVSSDLTMDKVLMEFKNDPRYTDLEDYWKDFKFVWENIRQSLDGYGIPVDGKLVFMSRENCRKKIDDKTPISFVLPTHKESGLCSFALLFFLMEKQNLFLQKYCRQSKIKYDSLPKVHVNDISSAHLISYHTDRDLLPMVLANCNYSFEEGQGTKVEYNFINLERQLMDRFLFTKSVILLKEIETVVYRSESTNAVVFGQLRDKIKQERLSPVVLSQIQIELHQKTFPDLCNSMDKLDITIGFLKSVGSDPEILLNDFMVTTLKIDNTFVSQKAKQSCKCKHTQSLWITLALEKNKRLEKSHKDSFEGVSSVFKEGLTDDLTGVLCELLDTLQLEQVEILMETLFECIIFTIDIPQRDEEFVDMSKVSLAEAMSIYWYDPPYTNDSPPHDWLKQFVEKLPKNLLCCYVAEIWTIINEIFTNKQEET